MTKPDPTTKNKAEPKSAPKDDLKTLPMAEVEKKLNSSPDGLTDAEAKKRLTQYGPNEIEEKKTNPILKFLSYFWGPIPWMIEVAVILSGVVRHWPDFFIILVLLIANAVVGFWEERQAGNAIDALKARLAINARVKRDGKWINPPARELVPGDAIRLRLGDIVPADARLLEGDEVSVDQSALTGESLPATRKPGEAVFSGSIVRRGEIGALVYATGLNTYFGKTAQLVEGAHTVSHFQKAVLKIGNYLIILAVAMVAMIVGVSIYRGEPMLHAVPPKDPILLFALVLTIAAIPVAMPTVLSVTMAVGARLLAKKKAIVSRLVAIEELAGVDVLCADKTGTLTQNKLTLGDPFTVDGIPADQVVLSGALASRGDDNDTIDLAVLGGLKDKDALKGYDIVHFVPFDPVHKRTEATVKGKDGKTFKVTKGAPQVILKLSDDAAKLKPATDKAVNDFAERGFRSLGVARAEGDGPWKFLGVLPLFDPPRVDAKATVATAGKMGVKIKMVTGDALAIAKETAKKLDMGTNILDAASLGDSKKQETAEVAESIEKADGFAQVFPEHKYHIVDVLQKRGHIVGMTGDGVNDAPALKKADCGIAVSGATDAARAAASIVLTTPGLSVIIDAIKESRRIFQRMNSYAIYRIAETLRVLLFMTAAILIFKFPPLTAIMIVMLALLNDGAILSIAYDNVKYENEPEAWNMRRVLGVASVLGVIGPIAAFGLFFLGDRVFHFDHDHLQPMMYLMLSVAGHMTIFLTRTRGPFWSIKPARILVLATVGTQILATFIAVYGFLMPPLGWGWAGFVWAYALVWAVLSDRVKLLAYRIFDPVTAGAKPEGAAQANSDATIGSPSETTTEQKPEGKADATPEAKDQAKPEGKVDATPEAKGQAKPEGKADATPEAKDPAKPEGKADATPEAKDPAKPEGKADAKDPAKPEGKADATPEAKGQAKPEGKADATPDAKDPAKPEVQPDATPEAKDPAKPEGKADATPEAKDPAKPEGKADATPDAKDPAKPGGKTDASLEANGQAKPEGKVDATPEAKGQAKPGGKTDASLEANGQAKPEGKADATPEANGQAKPDVKPDAKPTSPSDLTPQISKRAYELYEKRGRQSDHAVQDWEQAKREVQKDGTKAEPKPEAERTTAPDVTPKIVERVHELYEELGRKDVEAVQDMDRAKHDTLKDGQ
jgi:H+-transporting ATPase